MARRDGAWEIVRFSTIGVIAGGFSRLVAYAATELCDRGEHLGSWTTFADRAISDGGLYEQAGFTASAELPPQYCYVASGVRVHKFRYRIARFRSDPGLVFQEGLTERELAGLNNLPRIWDAGKTRYEKAVD